MSASSESPAGTNGSTSASGGTPTPDFGGANGSISSSAQIQHEASKASNGPGWTTWIDQFAIKSVLKRVYKQVPGRSDEFESVAQADNEVLGITFDHHAPPSAEQEPVGNSSSQRLVGKVKAKAEETEIVAETDVQEAVEVESIDMETGEVLAGDNDPQKPNLDDIPGIKKGSDLPPKVENKPVQSNEDFLAGLE